MASHFVISLDFELAWGLRDIAPADELQGAMAEVPTAIHGMLDVFRERELHATWASVGMLFAADDGEWQRRQPAVAPGYHDRALDPYLDGPTPGADRYAPELLRTIDATPHQEVGTHTFSHFYCLEAGASLEAFDADLALAQASAHDLLGHPLRSIVFPRNQYSEAHLERLTAHGITSYRSNPTQWMYAPRATGEHRRRDRIARLADTYLPVGSRRGSVSRRHHPGLVDVPATRFLRAWSPRNRWLTRWQLRRIRHEALAAARHGRDYHLWWHPHNFGRHTPENLSLLHRVADIVDEARALGMQSATMAEVAAATEASC